MRPEVASLLRAVVKLADEDIAELRDAVAEIDHREVDHYRENFAHITVLEQRMLRMEMLFADNANHSRKAGG